MKPIKSLAEFEAPPLNRKATAALIGQTPIYCDFRDLDDETQPFAIYLRNYPEVTITPDMLAARESGRSVGASDLFLPVESSGFKKVISVWREKGLVEALRVAAVQESENIGTPTKWIASKLTLVLDFATKGFSASDKLPAVGSNLIAETAFTKNWDTALVHCMAWHPHCSRLALATRDDRIRIYTKGIQQPAVLRNSAQKSVCSLSWQPYAGRKLAAACQSGVLIWSIELGAASNSLSHATLLKQRNHAPVTSVTWHPQGDLLVSCCPTDCNMIVWDVSKEVAVPLKRVGGGGLCFTRWSTCGSKLLSVASKRIFRVWNTSVTNSWQQERWTVPNGRVAVANFGPHQTLLFASTEEPMTLFFLPLQETIFEAKNSSGIDSDTVAVSVIDLAEVNFPSLEDVGLTVGGRIVSMDWDPSGKYLALLFQSSPVIALFETKVSSISRLIDIKPLTLVKGFPGEQPNCMQFYKDEGTCLSIAWSSGRIQHFPIVVDPEFSHNQSLSQTTYFTQRSAFNLSEVNQSIIFR